MERHSCLTRIVHEETAPRDAQGAVSPPEAKFCGCQSSQIALRRRTIRCRAMAAFSVDVTAEGGRRLPRRRSVIRRGRRLDRLTAEFSRVSRYGSAAARPSQRPQAGGRRRLERRPEPKGTLFHRPRSDVDLSRLREGGCRPDV